jgi:hypothetical protein
VIGWLTTGGPWLGFGDWKWKENSMGENAETALEQLARKEA